MSRDRCKQCNNKIGNYWVMALGFFFCSRECMKKFVRKHSYKHKVSH